MLAALFGSASAFAGEADINLPPLQDVSFLAGRLTSHAILFFGLVVCAVGAAFGFFEYARTRALPARARRRVHASTEPIDLRGAASRVAGLGS